MAAAVRELRHWWILVCRSTSEESNSIAAASDPDAEVVREAQRLGVTAIFRSPFDIDDLRTLVLNVIPRRHA